jgi:hypothetical protein
MYIRYLTSILLPSVALMGCAANQERVIPETGAELAAASTQLAASASAVETVDVQELNQQRTVCEEIRPLGSRISRGTRCYTPDATTADDSLQRETVRHQIDRMRREQEEMDRMQREQELARQPAVIQQSFPAP